MQLYHITILDNISNKPENIPKGVINNCRYSWLFVSHSLCLSACSSWCLSVLFLALHQSGRFRHQLGHSRHGRHLRLGLEPSQRHTGIKGRQPLRKETIQYDRKFIYQLCPPLPRRSVEPTGSGRPTRWWSTALWREPAWRSASRRWPRGRWCWPTWWSGQAWDPKLAPWPNRNWMTFSSLEQKSSSRMKEKVYFVKGNEDFQ